MSTTLIFTEGSIDQPDDFEQVVGRCVAALQGKQVEVQWDQDNLPFVMFEGYAIRLDEDENGMLTMEYLGKQVLH